MLLPDVIGFMFEEAMTELRNNGFSATQILIAKPAKMTAKPMGIARVVRLFPTGEDTLQVVIAYQDYGKEV